MDRFLLATVVVLLGLMAALAIHHINRIESLKEEIRGLELLTIEQRHELQTLKNTNEVLTEAFECQELRRQLGLIYDGR